MEYEMCVDFMSRQIPTHLTRAGFFKMLRITSIPLFHRLLGSFRIIDEKMFLKTLEWIIFHRMGDKKKKFRAFYEMWREKFGITKLRMMIDSGEGDDYSSVWAMTSNSKNRLFVNGNECWEKNFLSVGFEHKESSECVEFYVYE